MEIEHHRSGPARVRRGDHFFESNCHDRPFRVLGAIKDGVPRPTDIGGPIGRGTPEQGYGGRTDQDLWVTSSPYLISSSRTRCSSLLIFSTRRSGTMMSGSSLSFPF